MAFLISIKKIKEAKLKIENGIIWIVGSFLLVLMSIFSNSVVWIASVFGFISPSNFVFLVIILFILIQVFIDNIRIAQLNEKVKNLNHYLAINQLDAHHSLGGKNNDQEN